MDLETFSVFFIEGIYLKWEIHQSPVLCATSDPADGTVETEIINPAYIKVGPCPCDLTSESCDIGCCCDELCTEEDKMTFTCIPGVQGEEIWKHSIQILNLV